MDIEFMGAAIIEAGKAEKLLEVPIGAVIVYKDRIIGRGYNKKEKDNNPMAHAEIIAIKEATEYLDNWRLRECTLYVTVEPCPMCAGAIINSRIDRVVIGTRDKKSGACGSVINLLETDYLNHRVKLEFGVLEEECSRLMVDFFKKLRLK